jgi:hypothetical protein
VRRAWPGGWSSSSASKVPKLRGRPMRANAQRTRGAGVTGLSGTRSLHSHLRCLPCMETLLLRRATDRNLSHCVLHGCVDACAVPLRALQRSSLYRLDIQHSSAARTGGAYGIGRVTPGTLPPAASTRNELCTHCNLDPGDSLDDQRNYRLKEKKASSLAGHPVRLLHDKVTLS